MNLIENWKKAHKMISVQAMALALAIQATWTSLPPDLLASLPPHLGHYVTVALLALGIVGRIVVQDKVQNEDKQ